MVDGNRRRQGYSPASAPYRVAFFALNEEIRLPRGIVRRGNRERIKIPLLDIGVDSVAMQVSTEEVPQRRRIDQRMGVTSSQNRPKRKIQNPGKGVGGLGENIGAKDIRRLQTRPKLCDHLGCRRKIVAACGQRGTIDCSGGSGSYDGKGIAARPNPFDLAYALHNTRLISTAALRDWVAQFTRHYEGARFGDSAEDAGRLPELFEEISTAGRR